MKHLTIAVLSSVLFFYSCGENKTDNQTTEIEPKKDSVKKIEISETLEPPRIIQGQDNCPDGTLPNGVKVESIIIGNKRYEGQVTIDTKQFYGYSPYNIPFVACIVGNVSELYVDDKKVSEFTGEPGEVFFRRKIALLGGYNRIAVKAVGKSGEITEGYIEVTIQETPNKIEIK